MPFRGLTPLAQKALTTWTQAIARAHGAAALRPPHLIQAILDHFPTESAAACGLLGQTCEALVREANTFLQSERGPRLLGDVPPLPDARRVLETSAEVAREHGHEYIGIGHLFVACLAYISERHEPGWLPLATGAGGATTLAGRIIAAFGDTPAESDGPG